MDASAAPPRTVKSSAATTTLRPSTRARPVTKLVGVSSTRWPSSSYVADPVSPPTSANDSLSTSRSMRSRTVRRPAACCRPTRSSPPIRAASSRRRSSSASSGSHCVMASPTRSSGFAVDPALGVVGLRDDRVGEQLVDLVGLEAPAEQCLARVLAGHAWRPRNRSWRAREPRRRRGLDDPVEVDEALACRYVRVCRCLTRRQHRRDACVDAVEQRGPLVTRLGGEGALEQRAHLRPPRDIVLAGQLPGEVRSRLAQDAHQLCEELAFQRSDGDPPTVRALVRVVERRTTVEQVAAALVLPDA